MADDDNWLGLVANGHSYADGWDVPSAWSNGLPGANTAVTIDIGEANVTSGIAVGSIVDGDALTFEDAGNSTVTGRLTTGESHQNNPYPDGLFVDSFAGGEGGSTLMIGSSLTNNTLLSIGDLNLTADTTVAAAKLINRGAITVEGDDALSTAHRATLDVLGVATLGSSAGVVDDSVTLSGDALIEFGIGQITTIATHAILTMTGPDAYIGDAGSLTTNSALAGLAAVMGTLSINDGEQITTTGSLSNTGDVYIDYDPDIFGQTFTGGTRLMIGGTLTNEGLFWVGNALMSADDFVEASSVNNSHSFDSTVAAILLDGGSSSTHPVVAELDVTGAASFGVGAGILIGSVGVGDHALLEFGSGQITTIASGGVLSLGGPNAFVADAGAVTSNSALRGLATVDGALYFGDGASMSTKAGLTNAGVIDLDLGTIGDSRLGVGGELVNDDLVSVGYSAITASTTLVAATLDNAAGTIDLQGSATAVGALVSKGAAQNTGVINDRAGGYLVVDGDLTGSGTVNLSGGGKLFVGGSAIGETIAFGSGGGAVGVTAGDSLMADITGFGDRDGVDFSTLGYLSTDILAYAPNGGDAGGIVTVETNLRAPVASFAVTGDYTQDNFRLHADTANHIAVSYQR